MIYYIYKITFLCGEPAGRYYLGMHEYNGENVDKDSYAGSGIFCKAYYKKYGKRLGETYIKEILEINQNEIINGKREEVIIGDLWKTDPLCMNQCPGGRVWTIEQRDKRNKNYKRECRAVSQYNFEGVLVNTWNSIKEASQATGASITAIIDCCKGRVNSAKNYIWRYSEDDLYKYQVVKYSREQKKAKKKIDQFDLNGNFIKTWEGIGDTAKVFSSNKNGWVVLSAVLRGKVKSWYGYIWRYHKDN